MMRFPPATKKTMTDQPDVSPDAKEQDSAQRNRHETATGDNIQSLTDYFDQMDRAAFKRALANRDAHREGLNEPANLENLKRR